MKSRYFTIDQAIEVLKNPCDVTGGGGTSIVGGLEAAREIMDEFEADIGLPDIKKASIFVETDGKETVRDPDAVRRAAAAIRSHLLAPTVAVVSLGMDADDELLVEMADEPSERQVQHLATAGVLDLISQQPRRLFLKGHSQGELTVRQAEAIRQFVNVLSQTVGGA